MDRSRHAQSRITFGTNAGMTLLEVSIACAVLGVAFVYLFGSILSISALGGQTRERATAQSQVSSILAAIQPLSRAQMLAFTPPAVQGLGAGATAQVACLDGAGGAVTLPTGAATVLPDPAEVRVTVNWQDTRGRACSLVESAIFYGR